MKINKILKHIKYAYNGITIDRRIELDMWAIPLLIGVMNASTTSKKEFGFGIAILCFQLDITTEYDMIGTKYN